MSAHDAMLLSELARAADETDLNEITWQTLICAYLCHEGWRVVAEEVFRKHGYTPEEIQVLNGTETP